MAGELTPKVKGMSSHLMSNRIVPDSGLFFYCNAAVAKSVDAPVLETGGSLGYARPVGVRIPSAAPHCSSIFARAQGVCQVANAGRVPIVTVSAFIYLTQWLR